jgi:hypothetical protein
MKHCETCKCDEIVRTATVNQYNLLSVAGTHGIDPLQLQIAFNRAIAKLPPNARKEMCINVDSWTNR